MAHLRRRIGIVLQAYHLDLDRSALANVMLAGLVRSPSRSEAEEDARGLLNDLGIAASKDQPVGKMSGGQRQRVAIARALVGRPALILADEPTGALDSRSADTAVDALMGVTLSRGSALLIVTHDLGIASKTHTLIRIRDGALTDPSKEEPR